MDIKIIKGNESYLNDCIDSLKNSSLANAYFKTNEALANAILEIVDKDTFYVALSNNKCIGFFYIIPKGAFHSFPYLHLISIKEEYRSKGYGKLLLDEAIKVSYSFADKLFLVVGDFNLDAKRFYEKHGFIEVGLIPSLYRKDLNEYLMMLNMNKAN